MTITFNKKEIETQCEEFFSLYDVTKGDVYDMCQAKIIHTRAVAQNCYNIAKSHGCNQYDCDLAWIIGELHDFARFGQAITTKTFKDSEQFNHAYLGARILFEHGLVRDIIKNYDDIPKEDQTILEKAVRYHSLKDLPDDLTQRELFFCNTIQEGDKLDIFRAIIASGYYVICAHTKEQIEDSDISDAIADAFYKRELADYKKRVLPADFHMAHIALCFGLHGKESRRQAVADGYLIEMMDLHFTQPSVQKKWEEMKKITMDFLNEE